MLKGTLEKNNGTEFEATIESAAFSGTGPVRLTLNECTGTFGNITFTFGVNEGLPWCVQSTPKMEDDEFVLRGGACSAAKRPIHLTVDSTLLGECPYVQNLEWDGKYTTEATGDAVFSIVHEKEEKEAGAPFGCPAEGYFDLSFTLEREAAMAQPFYIS